jgi:hypothetical protein
MMTETQELEERRDDVRRTVFAGIARRRVVRKRQQIAAVAAGGLLLAAGVGLGAAKLVTQEPMQIDLTTAACYATGDTSQPTYYQDADGVGYDVVELCQEMWKRGALGISPRPDPNDMSADYPVPDIAVCIDRDGYYAGFPIWDAESHEALCTRLGLPFVE